MCNDLEPQFSVEFFFQHFIKVASLDSSFTETANLMNLKD